MKLAEDPLCERCLGDHLTVPPIMEHHKDRNQRNNESENKESLCVMHHEDEHREERWGK